MMASIPHSAGRRLHVSWELLFSPPQPPICWGRHIMPGRCTRQRDSPRSDILPSISFRCKILGLVQSRSDKPNMETCGNLSHTVVPALLACDSSVTLNPKTRPRKLLTGQNPIAACSPSCTMCSFIHTSCTKAQISCCSAPALVLSTLRAENAAPFVSNQA